MSQALSQIRGLHPIRAAAGLFRTGGSTLDGLDPDVVRYAAGVSVWGRWFVAFVTLFQFAYRFRFWFPNNFEFPLLLIVLVAFNGLVHYRLVTNRPVTWRWLLFLSAMDIVLTTVGVVFQGGFEDGYVFLVYYPALALFVVLFPSLWLGLAWTTMTVVVYVVIILAVSPPLNLIADDGKELVVRIATMYALVLWVSLIARYERVRRQAAVEGERRLQQERIEFSQAIHDTTAQSAYLIGLGIDAARKLAGDSNRELAARLEATSRLSKTAIWQLRHPIDMGSIFDGRGLGRTLGSHVATFTSVTSVEAELTQNGMEPPLSMEARSLLFTIAHNALANALRHAGASRVLVGLDFGEHELRMSVSDDGVGLPADYEERGHGFANMRADAERLGGRLIVEPRGPDGGARVACVMPIGRRGQEG